MQRDAELGFMKKPPKGDKRDPKRLKKDLPKFMKSLAPGERIMFLGATDQPWVADMGMLNQVFTRFIRVPKLFYGSRRLLLKHFITVLGGDIEETELAALTLIITRLMTSKMYVERNDNNLANGSRQMKSSFRSRDLKKLMRSSRRV